MMFEHVHKNSIFRDDKVGRRQITEEFYDKDGKPCDEQKAVAKRYLSHTVDCYAKMYEGDLYDPKSKYSKDVSFKFIRVGAKSFERYLEYLRTKNNRIMREVQRDYTL